MCRNIKTLFNLEPPNLILMAKAQLLSESGLMWKKAAGQLGVGLSKLERMLKVMEI